MVGSLRNVISRFFRNEFMPALGTGKGAGAGAGVSREDECGGQQW